MELHPGKMLDFLKMWRPLNPAGYPKRILAYLDYLTSTKQDPGPESLQAYMDERIETGMAAATIRLDFFAVKKYLLDYHDYTASAGAMGNAEIERYSLALGFNSIRLPIADPGRRAQLVAEFTKESLDHVIVSATKRTGALIEFLVNTGFRVSELVTIRLKNVAYIDRKWCYVTVLGKGRKERSVWVLASLVTRVRRIFQGEEFLFESKNGRRLLQRNVRQYVTTAFRQYAGISLSPHSLRHLHSIMLLDGGERLGQVSAALGHASVTTTAKIYDRARLRKEAYNIKHHGNRGAKGGNSNGRRPKNLPAS